MTFKMLDIQDSENYSETVFDRTLFLPTMQIIRPNQN